jgi:hypothetical protein
MAARQDAYSIQYINYGSNLYKLSFNDIKKLFELNILCDQLRFFMASSVVSLTYTYLFHGCSFICSYSYFLFTYITSKEFYYFFVAIHPFNVCFTLVPNSSRSISLC